MSSRATCSCGPNGTLVLTDFGIARSAGAAQLTAAGSVLGTATYISPEQAMGEQASALSDIYALGVVAYQCLAGRRPFEGENPLEIAMRHVRETPPPLPPDIPPQVRAIVERAMAKDPTARWPTASAFAGIARRCAADLAAAGPRPVGVPPAVPTGSPVSGGPTPVPVPMSPGTPPGIRSTATVRPGIAPAPTYHAPGAPYVPPGYLPAPVPQQPKQASTGLIVAIVVAVVVVADLRRGGGRDHPESAARQRVTRRARHRDHFDTPCRRPGRWRWAGWTRHSWAVRGTAWQRQVGDDVMKTDEGRLER